MGRAGRLVGGIVALSLLALCLAIGLPALTGRPVVTYASSASMEPTIGVFDVFLVDPWPQRVEPGDIIVYDSVLQGGPAVHRIVAGDEAGWYTQGDANPAPDQDGGEPLVTRERLLGKVVTRADGSPILFDDVGITLVESRAEIARAEQAVGGSRQLLALVFLGIAALTAIPAFFGQAKRRPPARVSPRLQRFLRRAFPRGILGRHLGLALLLLLLASMAWTAAHARVDVVTTLVVVESPGAADTVRAAAPGGELAREIRVGSLGIVPTIAILDPPDRMRADERSVVLAPASTTTTVVHQRAGDAIGLQEDALAIWRYPAFLPSDAMIAMHEAAPGSPYILLAGVVSAVGYAWFALLRIGSLPVGRFLRIREGWL